MNAKRPKLVVGRSYRFTFTPAEWRGPDRSTHSTVVTIGDRADHTPRAVTMWANRWVAYGRNTVEIIDVTDTTNTNNGDQPS